MSDKRLNTPILLIGFNRPDLIKRVLAQIKLVKPRKLYLAVDGARNNDEEMKVRLVKNIIKLVDWDCKVKTLFADQNYGCKLGPVRAMNWFFKNEEAGIILEDDVLADESFFYYCQELLEKYKNNNRIGTISGDNYTKIYDRNSYLFSKYSQTWGWATWRRVWNKYDIEIMDWPEKNSNNWLKNVFNNYWTVSYWKLVFYQIYNNVITTAWDYQWTYMSWKYNLLTIIPKNNLVTNIGIGVEGATHTKVKNVLFEYPRHKIIFPLVHPKNIEINKKLDNYIQKNGYVLWKEVGMFFVRKYKQLAKTS